MTLKERLSEIMANEFGITTDEQLIAAVSKIDLDLGIFTASVRTEELPKGEKPCTSKTKAQNTRRSGSDLRLRATP